MVTHVTFPGTDNVAKATAAAYHMRTWNGIDGDADPSQHYRNFNDWTDGDFGANHFYSYDLRTIPVSQLRPGTNTFTWYSATTAHHGIEILWPGPALVVRYSGTPTNNPPSITAHPTDQTVAEGETATFTVAATGSGTLGYQWQKNQSDIGGATSASYTTPVLDSCRQRVALSLRCHEPLRQCHQQRSVAARHERARTDHHGRAHATDGAGRSAGLVQRHGHGDGAVDVSVAEERREHRGRERPDLFHFGGRVCGQWRIVPVHRVEFERGGYQQRGHAERDTRCPHDHHASGQRAGERWRLRRHSRWLRQGAFPRSYEWQKDGTPIPGATAASYSFVAAKADSGAAFRCKVTNGAGSVTSNPGYLIVGTFPPTITAHPAQAFVRLGQTATFSVTATGNETVNLPMAAGQRRYPRRQQFIVHHSAGCSGRQRPLISVRCDERLRDGHQRSGGSFGDIGCPQPDCERRL